MNKSNGVAIIFQLFVVQFDKAFKGIPLKYELLEHFLKLVLNRFLG